MNDGSSEGSTSRLTRFWSVTFWVRRVKNGGGDLLIPIQPIMAIFARRRTMRAKTSRLPIERMRRPTTPKMAVPKNREALLTASNSWKALQSIRPLDERWVVRGINVATDAILERHFLGAPCQKRWRRSADSNSTDYGNLRATTDDARESRRHHANGCGRSTSDPKCRRHF